MNASKKAALEKEASEKSALKINASKNETSRKTTSGNEASILHCIVAYGINDTRSQVYIFYLMFCYYS